MANPKLQPCDIFVEKTHGWFGLPVELLMKQHYQHVKMVRADTQTIIEDGINGIAIKQLDTDWTNFEVWRIKDFALVSQMNTLAKLETRIGEWYSELELIAEGLRRAYRISIPDMPGADCSEFLSWGIREGGGIKLFDMPDNEVAPWDFRNPDKLERIF